MKHLYSLLLLLMVSIAGLAQTTLVSGPSVSTVYLVPFTSACLNTATQNAGTCGGSIIGTFNFTSPQCCACPTSGMVCAPGSVAYGGPGTSASFIHYHTLSYSPSNEHQQYVFSGAITRMQFSVAGPAGASELFQAQTYNGGTLISTHTFATGGTGVNLTYTISGVPFTRVQFTEINAISADDELFGDIFVGGGACTILPEESLDFVAAPINDHEVEARWKTDGEIDNHIFVVERTIDGATWSEIGSVLGAGTTGDSHSYQLVDHAPFSGINYYRLRTVDGQGNSDYSQVVAVNMNADREEVIVYPNPAGDWLHFNFGNITGDMEVTFINSLGQIVKQKSCNESLSALEVSDLTSGVYTLRITLPDGTHSNKSILKK
jgi:hypothetical protein